MTITNKDLASSIINFLKNSVKNNEIPEDYAESMDVAIDCIADAFEVDKDKDKEAIDNKFGGKGLLELLNSNKNEYEISTDASKTEVNEEKKKEADELKVEGNRLMAARDFAAAVEKYTDAIKLNPDNEVYYSNRAAAYLSSSMFEEAVVDAEKAIEINPNFVKAYSRLGLAKYSLGDAQAAMKAYEKGLEKEGDKKSDAMLKGFETAKKRVEESLEDSIPPSEVSERGEGSTSGTDASGSTGNNAGGMPDLSSLFGNGGGMPSLGEMFSNPQVMQAAQNLMSNPSAMQNIMNNPAIRQMADNFGGEGGSAPNFSDMMNNPMLQNLAKQFMGGNNENNGNNSQ